MSENSYAALNHNPEASEPIFDDPSLLENCPTCAELMQGGSWQRISSEQLRWTWTGDHQVEPAHMVSSGVEIVFFPATHPQEKIAVVICRDGGLISYRRQNGRWIHTISSLSAFRKRIFELNLVPLEQLGVFLKRVKA